MVLERFLGKGYRSFESDIRRRNVSLSLATNWKKVGQSANLSLISRLNTRPIRSPLPRVRIDRYIRAQPLPQEIEIARAIPWKNWDRWIIVNKIWTRDVSSVSLKRNHLVGRTLSRSSSPRLFSFHLVACFLRATRCLATMRTRI